MSTDPDVMLVPESQGQLYDVIRVNIQRILGSENLPPTVTTVLAQLASGDRGTLKSFLTEEGTVDLSEVVRFAHLHRSNEPFVIDSAVRRPVEL